jgi:hypothetical protein
MSNGENNSVSPVVSIKADIAATTEINNPFPKLWRHLIGGPAGLRMGRKKLNALADCLYRTLGGIRVFCFSKIHATERHLGARKATRSAVALRCFSVLSCLQLGKPRICFIASHMQPGCLVGFPGRQPGLTEFFAFFLAFKVLLDGFAHYPVSRTPSRRRKLFHPIFYFVIEL